MFIPMFTVITGIRATPSKNVSSGMSMRKLHINSLHAQSIIRVFALYSYILKYPMILLADS